MLRDGLFTSESVTEGHPDKMADQISDGILDMLLQRDIAAGADPLNTRVAAETLLTTDYVCVAGEVTTAVPFIGEEIEQWVRQICCDIGYTHDDIGFDGRRCEVDVRLHRQSPDIARGVNVGEGLFTEQGAGDQGMMFGYAARETPELMPASIALAHQLTRRMAQVRRDGTLPFLRPDGKSQVTVEYRDGIVRGVDTVVLSAHHAPDISYVDLSDALMQHVVRPVIPEKLRNLSTKFFINPTGSFVVGGPHGDTGVTGRKIIVDTYGGHGAHGGGAFSGKDPSKVDRSAAYMARYIAKNIVAAGLATRCLVQIAYAIGVAEPVSICVETFGTSIYTGLQLASAVRLIFPLKPAQIIAHLNLLRPIYRATASGGHFGRPEFRWEEADKINELRSCFKLSTIAEEARVLTADQTRTLQEF